MNATLIRLGPDSGWPGNISCQRTDMKGRAIHRQTKISGFRSGFRSLGLAYLKKGIHEDLVEFFMVYETLFQYGGQIGDVF